MCGRYSLSRPVDELADFFDAHLAPGLAEAYQPSYNIAPTRSVVGLACTSHHQRVLALYHWGFGNRQFNTRSEGVSDARSMGVSDARSVGVSDAVHRMAVVADGFFEWRADEGRRQPLFFRRAD